LNQAVENPDLKNGDSVCCDRVVKTLAIPSRAKRKRFQFASAIYIENEKRTREMPVVVEQSRNKEPENAFPDTEETPGGHPRDTPPHAHTVTLTAC